MFNDYIKKILNFLCFLLFIFNINSLFCAEYKLGGKVGWDKVKTRIGITEGKGRFGYTSLELDTNSFKISEETDLLFDFEQNEQTDLTGNYSVVNNNLYYAEKAAMGKKSGLSRKNSGGLIIEGNDYSIFGKSGPTGSFSIEFWICPSTVENGEVLLNWRSSLNDSNTVEYQVINVYVDRHKLKWLFSNIFYGYKDNSGDIELWGKDTLVPNEWSLHSFSYNENNGAIEYRVNGMLEDIKYVTTHKTEEGSIFLANTGIKANLEICPDYTGFIDDFRIEKTSYDERLEQIAENASFLHRSLYKTNGGRFESVPLLTKPGSRLNNISAVMNVPMQTSVEFYVRSGDNCYNWTDSYPEWVLVKEGEEISGINGLYFQVAAELYPDGNGTVSPSVTEITLNYEEIPLPLPPFNIYAEKGNEKVTLHWSYSVDEHVGGYYVYYGTRPGEYLGRFAIEGDSPINVGNVNSFTVSGLKNGTIYYFAVSAWSNIDNKICGELSKEVYARPSVK